jgi:hypothetical protein
MGQMLGDRPSPILPPTRTVYTGNQNLLQRAIGDRGQSKQMPLVSMNPMMQKIAQAATMSVPMPQQNTVQRSVSERGQPTRTRGGGVPDTAPAEMTGARRSSPWLEKGTTDEVRTTPQQGRETERENRNPYGNIPGIGNVVEGMNRISPDRITHFDTEKKYTVVSQLDKEDYRMIDETDSAEELIDVSTDLVLDVLEDSGQPIDPAWEQQYKATALAFAQEWYTLTKANQGSTQNTDLLMALTQYAYETMGQPGTGTRTRPQPVVTQTTTTATPPAATGTFDPTYGANPGIEGETLSEDDLPSLEEAYAALRSQDLAQTYLTWAVEQPDGIDNSIQGFLAAYGVTQ